MISTVILAGGKSARMGTDKALVLYQGIPLLERVIKVAKKCSSLIYIVTLKPDPYQMIGDDLNFVTDYRGEGPLVGFLQVQGKITTDWILLLSCDLPNLSVEILQGAIAELDSVSSDAIAYLARNPKGWEPLCGFYRKSALDSLVDFVNFGGRSFQKWLSLNSVQEWSVSDRDRDMFFNCNSPQDLE